MTLFVILNFKLSALYLKLSRTTVISILGLFLFLGASVQAATLNVIRPSQGEKVSGVYEVGWSVFNTGVPSVLYDVRVKNASCTDGGISIAGNFASTIQNGYYVQNWDTKTVSDGGHCIQFCIKYDAGNVECAQKAFSVVNFTNNPPIITSYPSKLNYISTEKFEYQVQASDPDGDQIVYKILSGPDFIFLDQNGYMSLGTYMQSGSYEIAIAVIDSYGAAAQQTFTLNVVAPTPTPIPLPTKNPSASSTPKATEEPQNDESEVVDLLSPDSTSVFKGIENYIKWEFSNIDDDDIGQIIIEYSDNQGEDYNEMYTHEQGNLRIYKWDVTDLSNGEYVIRIRVIGKNNVEIAQTTSDSFIIANEEEDLNMLSVFDLYPDNKEEISNKLPVISGKFSPSKDSDIVVESIVIKLDGKNISDSCSIDDLGFECEIADELKEGEHSMNVSVEDSNEQTLDRSWIFYITEPGATPAPTDEATKTFEFPEINFDAKLLYLCGGGFLVILLLVFIISILKKRKDYQYDDYDSSGAGSAANSVQDFSQPATSSNEDMNFDDFSIGSHDVVSSEADLASPTPSSEYSEDNVPDWLKGNADSEAQPAGVQSFDSAGSGDQDSSKVHDNFGLTPVDTNNG